MFAKRWTAAIVIAAALVFAAAGGSFAANWIDSADTSWYDAASEETTFTITTAEQLAGLAKLVNEGTEIFSEKTVQLGSNIDLSGKDWTAIGINGSTFRGTLDGQGYTISGLGAIKSAENKAADKYQYGFFSSLSGSWYIKNLNIIGNVSISPEDTGDTPSEYYVGAFVGYAAGNVTSTPISNCTFKGSVKGYRNGSIGGIIGYNVSVKIYNTFVDADITTDNTNSTNNQASIYMGGICGYANQAIENCYFRGTIKNTIAAGPVSAGGIVGSCLPSASITNCAVSCDIDVIGSQSSNVNPEDGDTMNNAGGILGIVHWQIISGCSAEGSIKISSSTPGDTYINAGGIVGVKAMNQELALEHCSASMKINAGGGYAGGLVSLRDKVSNLKMYQCERLVGEGYPDSDYAASFSIDPSDNYSVTQVSDAAELTPASLLVAPTTRLTENRPVEVSAMIFPSETKKTDSLIWAWGSSDTNVITVLSHENATAEVIGLSGGSADITASVSGFLGENTWTATSFASVTKIALDSMTLDAESITLGAVGDSAVVTAILSPSDGASYPVLLWSFEALSGEGASADDIEVTPVDGSLKVKISLLKLVPDAQYRLTATAVDGTGLSANVLVNVQESQPADEEPEPSQPSQPNHGSSGGGCSAAGYGALSLAALAPLFCLGKRRSGNGK